LRDMFLIACQLEKQLYFRATDALMSFTFIGTTHLTNIMTMQ